MTNMTIFEGPDGGGKTTLIRKLELEGRYSIRLENHGPYPGLTDIYYKYAYPMTQYKLEHKLNELLIFDRSWLAEPIYGNAFRNGLCRITPTQRYDLERIALDLDALVILCLPPYKICLNNWSLRRNIEYLNNEIQLLAVYQGYEQMHMKTNLKIINYDYTKEFDREHILNFIGD